MSKLWFYRREETQFGPYDASELKKLAKDGTLRPSDLVARAGNGKWVAAASVKGLFAKALSAAASPPPLPSPASSGPERVKGDSRRGGGMLTTGSAATPKTAARAKKTLVLALLALLGVAGSAGVVLPLALKQFAAVPFKKAPPLSESWKDFVDAIFFPHYVSCSNPDGSVLLNASQEYLQSQRRTESVTSVIHLLAVTHRDLENTSEVEFPIQGVVRGYYYIFPVYRGKKAGLGDVEYYEQYSIELRFVPKTFAEERFLFYSDDHEVTEWSLKTATVQKAMSGGRVVSESPESLSIARHDVGGIGELDRFPAMRVFRSATLGGYWPTHQTLAIASRDVLALRWKLEQDFDFPKNWGEEINNDAYMNWRKSLQKRLSAAIKDQVEIARPLLATLPTPRSIDDRSSHWRVFESRNKFEQLQLIAAELCAIINVGSRHSLPGYNRDALKEVPESDVVCEVLARAIPGFEAFEYGDLDQRELYRLKAGEWFRFSSDPTFWHYPPPTPPTQTQQAGRRDESRQDERPAASYEVKYEVFSPGPVSVRYRNGLGGWDEKQMAAKQDGSYVIEVTLSASETAQITARALDRDAPISAWIYVNGTRVAVSSDNDGGGTVTASGNQQSPEQ